MNKFLYTHARTADIYLLDLLFKELVPARAEVLDAGCGDGRNLPVLAGAGMEVFAMDADPEKVNRARDRMRNCFPGFDVQRIRPGYIESGISRTYDLVVCCAVLHFSKDACQFELMFRALASGCRPGGILFLRMVTSHTLCKIAGPFHRKMLLGDGTTRFVAGKEQIEELIDSEHFSYVEPFKTVNVNDMRTMTTLVLRKA